MYMKVFSDKVVSVQYVVVHIAELNIIILAPGIHFLGSPVSNVKLLVLANVIRRPPRYAT